METTGQLQKLFDKCKCSVIIDYNQHKAVYENIKDYLTRFEKDEINPEVYKEIIKRDQIVELQFYPDTPIGFYLLIHYDLSKAIEEANNILK